MFVAHDHELDFACFLCAASHLMTYSLILACCLVATEAEIGSAFVLPARRFTLTMAAHSYFATRQSNNHHHAATVGDNIILESSALGTLRRIRVPGGDKDLSFLGANSVPTFSSTLDSHHQHSITTTITADTQQRRARGLEGVLGQGPAFVVDDIFSKQTCDELIQTCEALGFGSYRAGKNHHGALQILVSKEISDAVGQALAPLVDIDDVLFNMMTTEEGNRTNPEDIRLAYRGLNRRWRVYRYEPGGAETFAPHIDAGFPPSSVSEDGETLVWDASTESEEQLVSRLTVLMYLNDDFVAGETKFYRPLADLSDEPTDANPVIASVRPRMGSILVFPQAVGEEAVAFARKHWPVHEGAPVASGSPKYVIRSDILFATERKHLQLDDKLFRFDHLVRDAFMPHSEVYTQAFLHHVSSLYNPHMGVENLGPFLYSFLRFTKQRRILEIGAGYTTLWILQALKDNEREMKRIYRLEQNDECRLLDCQWSIPEIVNEYSLTSSSLLCVDNCVHQKETATGAAAMAEVLGLGQYLEFLNQDAFELDLEPDSIDVLWCDFGVGARMREFVSRAWRAVRPGGFLLCHSTLTNQRTRQWLEAARSRTGQDLTGIPPDEYVEISFLEPHKRYQNSVSVFQKRKDADGKQVEEPIYSEYA